MLKKLFKISIAVILVAAIAFTVFWFSQPVDVSFEEFRDSVPHSAHSHFVEVNGVRIHFQKKGNGEPLILLHGYTSSTYSWKDVFEPLSQKFQVIAVDLKGFGFSDKPNGDYTRRSQAELIVNLLDLLKIEKAWLCGNSMGGEIALNVALQNPHRIAGLILIDSAGVETSGGSSLTPTYARIPLINQALIALTLTSDKLVREGLEKSFYDDSKVTNERIDYYYKPLQTRYGQQAALLARIQAGQFPIEQDLNKINAPTLIIWGERDEVIPLEAGRKMSSLIKNSRLLVIENCGHLPQEETPDLITLEITNFIEQSNQVKV